MRWSIDNKKYLNIENGCPVGWPFYSDRVDIFCPSPLKHKHILLPVGVMSLTSPERMKSIA